MTNNQYHVSHTDLPTLTVSARSALSAARAASRRYRRVYGAPPATLRALYVTSGSRNWRYPVRADGTVLAPGNA